MIKLRKPSVGFYLLGVALLFSIVAFVFYFLTYAALKYNQNYWVIAMMVIAFWSFACLIVNAQLGGGTKPFWMDIFYAFSAFALTIAAVLFLIPCLSPIGIYFTVGNMGDVAANAVGVPRCIVGIVFYVLAVVCVIVAAFFKLSEEDVLEENKEFRGSYMLNFLLTLFCGFTALCTLGFAYPWARSIKLKWQARHSYIDGKQLIFNGDVRAIYKKYLIGLLLTYATLGIYGRFFFPIEIRRWIMENTNLKGEEGQFEFNGKVLPYVGISLLTILINVCSLFFCAYWAQYIRERWIAKHTTIGQTHVEKEEVHDEIG